MKLKDIARLLLGLLGLGGMLAAVLAYRLGLDKNPAWGSSRTVLFALGLAVFLWAVRVRLSRRLAPWLGRLRRAWQAHIGRPFHLWVERFKASRAYRLAGTALTGIRSIPGVQTLGRIKTPLLLVIASVGIAAFYLWVVTSGTWTAWPTASSYYDKLADAFVHGQLSLLEKPSVELLALQDPYDLQQRLESGASYLSDVSLYNARFYIYWGPVPALLFAAAKGLYPAILNDAYLVLVFLLGMLFWMGLLWNLMWKRFSGKSAGASTILFLLIAAAVVPIPYLLARPGTYEASIAGGQFFLLGALTFVFLAFRGPGRAQKGWLMLSSLFIILAVGTRISLAFCLLFLSGMVLLYLLLAQRGLRDRILNIVLFVLPQAVGTFLLLLYNHLRFGSWWEFGMRYALSITNMPKAAPYFLHPSNILPNLYLYLFRTPEFSLNFPFLSVPWVEAGSWPFFIRLPAAYYYSEPVAGLVWMAPLVLFSWFSYKAAGRVLLGWRGAARGKSFPVEGDAAAFQSWWLVTISGMSIIAFVTVQLFFAATMRYMMDFIPLLVVLSFAGFWMPAGEAGAARKVVRRGMAVLFVVICFCTLLAGLLLSVSGPNNHLLNNNPGLYDQLAHFFDAWTGP